MNFQDHSVNTPLLKKVNELTIYKNRNHIFSYEYLCFGDGWGMEAEDYGNIWLFTCFIRSNLDRFIEVLVNDGAGLTEFLSDFVNTNYKRFCAMIIIEIELLRHFDPILQELKLRCPYYAWTKCDKATRLFFMESDCCNYTLLNPEDFYI